MDALEAWCMRLVQIVMTAVLGHSHANPTPVEIRRALERVGPPPVAPTWPWAHVRKTVERFWAALDGQWDDTALRKRLAFLELENRDQARELDKLRSQTRATLRAKLDHFGDLAMEAVKDPNHPDIQSCIRLYGALQGAQVVSRFQEVQERLVLTEETLRRTENARAQWHDVVKRYQEHPAALLVGGAYEDRDIRVSTRDGQLRVELLGQQRTPVDAVQVPVDDWLEFSLVDMGVAMENGDHSVKACKRSDHIPESW